MGILPMLSVQRSVSAPVTSHAIRPRGQHDLTENAAQPTFLAYDNLATRPAVLAAINGIFQTGGVIGTLTLLVNPASYGGLY